MNMGNQPLNQSGHAHGHIHDHDHHDDHGHRRSAPGAFRWSIVLNSGLTALQLVIGFGFGSVALIGDALHNLGDVVGLFLGWGAERLSQRPASGRFTYGYGRSTHMASLVNGLLLFSAGVVVVVEAIQRLVYPVPLVAGPVAWAAAAGIAVNLISARLFDHDHHHDLNQRAAVLHLLTDAAVSVAVLISAILVGITGWLWLDAVTAIGVGAAVIWSAWGLLAEAIAVNLDAAPRHIEVGRIRQVLLDLPGVVEVEELHVWGLSTSRTALTAHIQCRAATFTDAEEFLEQARRRLSEMGIRKSTLQLETACHQLPGETAIR
jgi:cobalt-zinc-cadmium efflux system protein